MVQLIQFKTQVALVTKSYRCGGGLAYMSLTGVTPVNLSNLSICLRSERSGLDRAIRCPLEDAHQGKQYRLVAMTQLFDSTLWEVPFFRISEADWERPFRCRLSIVIEID